MKILGISAITMNLKGLLLKYFPNYLVIFYFYVNFKFYTHLLIFFSPKIIIVYEKKDAGVYSVKWKGYDNCNCKLTTGVYFIRLTSGDFSSVKKVILIR